MFALVSAYAVSLGKVLVKKKEMLVSVTVLFLKKEINEQGKRSHTMENKGRYYSKILLLVSFCFS